MNNITNENNTITISKSDFEDLVVQSLRYCIINRTYGNNKTIEIISKYLGNISDCSLKLLEGIIEYNRDCFFDQRDNDMITVFYQDILNQLEAK